jgi:hypothetical protein
MRFLLFVVGVAAHDAALNTALSTCPTRIFTDRGCTGQNFTTHKNIASPTDCCALCNSLRNSPTTPCAAWTFHTSGKLCETAPFPSVAFGKNKISGTFVPTPAPKHPTPKAPTPGSPTPRPSPPEPAKPTPPPSPFVPTPAPRNVLYFVFDDLRADLSMYSTPWMKTPNIQKLADTGTVFERAYCQQTVCSPSRMSFTTGRRPESTKVGRFWPVLVMNLPCSPTLFSSIS